MRAGVESNHQFKQSSGAREKTSKRKKKKIQRHVHDSEILIAILIEKQPLGN